jgi:hypothetical protein
VQEECDITKGKKERIKYSDVKTPEDKILRNINTPVYTPLPE